jgi:hypothetical protein
MCPLECNFGTTFSAPPTSPAAAHAQLVALSAVVLLNCEVAPPAHCWNTSAEDTTVRQVQKLSDVLLKLFKMPVYMLCHMHAQSHYVL